LNQDFQDFRILESSASIQDWKLASKTKALQSTIPKKNILSEKQTNKQRQIS
jgi:hypothetical protein